MVVPKNGGVVTQEAPTIPEIPQNAFQVLIPTVIQGLNRAYGDYQINQMEHLPTMSDDELRQMRDIAAYVRQTQGMLEHLTTLQIPTAPQGAPPDPEQPKRDLTVPFPTSPVQEKLDLDTRAVRHIYPKMEEPFDYGNLRHRNLLGNWIAKMFAEHTYQEFGGIKGWMPTRTLNAVAADHFFMFRNDGSCPDVVDEGTKGMVISDACRKAIGYVLQALSKADFIYNEGSNSSNWALTPAGEAFLSNLLAQLPR